MIKIWSLENYEDIYTVEGHNSKIKSLDITHNDKILVSAGKD